MTPTVVDGYYKVTVNVPANATGITYKVEAEDTDKVVEDGTGVYAQTGAKVYVTVSLKDYTVTGTNVKLKATQGGTAVKGGYTTTVTSSTGAIPTRRR